MVLYKYFPPERSAFLKELLLRFTPPGSFNDPFDSFPAFYGFDETLISAKINKAVSDIAFNIALESSSEFERQRKLSVLPQANEILRKHYLSNPSRLDDVFAGLHRKRVNSDIGILCLCDSPKSVVMWSHYAREHKGFVVGFESRDGFFSHQPNDPIDIGVLNLVNYSKSRPLIDVRTIKEGENLPDILFTKNEEWSYEKEWRIIRFLKDADEVRDENVHLFRMSPVAVHEVILGSNSDEFVRNSLLEAVKHNLKLSHVEFFTAQLSSKHYEMEILPYSSSISWSADDQDPFRSRLR
jgi:hypothetical protein